MLVNNHGPWLYNILLGAINAQLLRRHCYGSPRYRLTYYYYHCRSTRPSSGKVTRRASTRIMNIIRIRHE